MTMLTTTEARPDNVPAVVKEALTAALKCTQFPLSSTYNATVLTYANSDITLSLFFFSNKLADPTTMNELVSIAASAKSFVTSVILKVPEAWSFVFVREPVLRHVVHQTGVSKVQIDVVLRLESFKGSPS